MCRFVAYLGKKPITLDRVIDKPSRSLINQSRKAREGATLLNADGFGIAWYNHEIDPTAGIFKSVLPAWNDQNLRHIASKVRSTCFLGHVRASTVGNVNDLNCHPFSFDNLSFVHNGTINHFNAIKRELLDSLRNNAYFSIHGGTDSEHFFALFHDLLHRKYKTFGLNELTHTMLRSIETIRSLQANVAQSDFSYLNTVLTDGTQLIATRYVSNQDELPHSLYYSIGDYVMSEVGKGLMHAVNTKKRGAILVASEPINEIESEWIEVPKNHILTVDQQLQVNVKPIEI